MLEKEAAFNSMVIRVVVPAKDIKNIHKAADELDITILDTIYTEKEDVLVVELYVRLSYNIYALGKLVAYYELSK